jgi:hypothetical protein
MRCGCRLFDKLSYFYVYNGIDRRDVLATVIKWTTVAPFNFVLKQLVKKYMNALSFSGERDGGKTALSDISLSIHGHFEDKSVTEQSPGLSAGSMNTDAKFGDGVSHTTFPIAISEYGRVEAYGRDEKLLETVKNAIDPEPCDPATDPTCTPEDPEPCDPATDPTCTPDNRK